jgi:hypothetical protein
MLESNPRIDSGGVAGIVPEVSFEDEFDYKANPGVRLRVEVFFGADKVNQFWRREHEDTEDFRW